MLRKILTGFIAASIVTNVYALEIDAELSSGYDDNPFKLVDILNPEGGWFVDTELKAKQHFGDFRIRGGLTNRSYEGSLDDADSTTVTLDGRYKKKHTLADKTAYSHIILKYKNKNKTYVRRSTGEVGIFSGQEIKDRYDYNSWSIEAKTRVNLTKQVKTGLEINYLRKDYDDPNIVGLSNLDYDQIELSNDWNYKHSDRSEFEFVWGIRQREFDDKREKILDGTDVAGTDLEYDYYFASISHNYELSSQLESEIEVSYKERDDSGTGYYDTDDFKISAELDYKINKSLTLAANVTYQDLEYDNRSTVDEDDEVLPGKEGYTIKLHLEKELDTQKMLPIALFAGVRYDDYDSDDSFYEYDRVQVFAGLEINFSK